MIVAEGGWLLEGEEVEGLVGVVFGRTVAVFWVVCGVVVVGGAFWCWTCGLLRASR